jgi:aspartyl-tRNA(Asn)/glutamyl-tRNA(Gln) amidotransferase subunit A
MKWLGLGEASELIRKRELSPVELCRHYLSRIEALDGDLHAFKLVIAQSAMAEAKAAEQALARRESVGPLHGIPFAVKDCFDVKGLPTTMGSRVLANNIAAADAGVVRRLREAGMVLLGKTHLVQFAFGGVGINNDDGTPRNPWIAEPHVPGGSSSGSAVAVAAGLAPVALGSDTGGSIRIPSSLCGVTGLKTSAGSLDMSGVAPLSWTLDTVGPLAGTAYDAALVYGTMRDGGAPELGSSSDLSGVRLAFAETVFWDDADPEVTDAVRATGKVFSHLGANVDSMPFEWAAEARRLNPDGIVAGAEAYTVNRELVENHFDELDPLVSQRLITNRDFLAQDYLRVKNQWWPELRRKTYEAMAGIDALLVPTTAIPALPTAPIVASVDEYNRVNRLYLRNTVIGNVLDLCAVSVPCGFTSKGLPIGLMLYAKPHSEPLLLRIAHAFQQVTDFHKQHPPLPM